MRPGARQGIPPWRPHISLWVIVLVVWTPRVLLPAVGMWLSWHILALFRVPTCGLNTAVRRGTVERTAGPRILLLDSVTDAWVIGADQDLVTDLPGWAYLRDQKVVGDVR